MKNLSIIALSLLTTLGFSQTKDVSTYDEKLLNWQSKDLSTSIMGTNTTKAYKELLAGKKPKAKIIVAVIDAGIDISHEDLKDNIWVNEDEIPGNGIDDDNNGYIDDINGWNFLGNSKGENIGAATLEKTRIYRNLREVYRNTKNASEVEAGKQKEYKLYLKLKEEITNKKRELSKELDQMESLKGNISRALASMRDNPDTKKESIEKIVAIEKEIDDYLEYLNDQKKAHYNTSFYPRRDIIGDDLNDINDKGYGNGNVAGPDAFHGTFCAGIIGATQNNELGINGIANNVLLMSLRAVPNGDEYDKDVALAIRYAVDNGAKVINMSFGKAYSPNKKMVDDAMKYAEEKGVLLIHAAGNDSKNIDKGDNFPTDNLLDGSNASNVITVGASTISTKKKLAASFSNFGDKDVDIFAPGQDVVSTTIESEYEISQGTSFAAPVVSGVAALVWSYYPQLTAAQVKEIVLKSATNVGKKKVVIPGSRKKKIRFRELCVSDGVVNTYNALLMAEEMTK